MTKDTKIGLGIIAGTLLWYNVFRGIKAIKIAFDQIRYISYGGDNLTLAVDFRIKNPLFVGVLITNIQGDIYLMDKKVAYIDYPFNQRIRPRSISSFTIQFTASISSLGQALWTNIQTGDINTLAARFVGTIHSEKISIPIDKTFTYDEVFN